MDEVAAQLHSEQRVPRRRGGLPSAKCGDVCSADSRELGGRAFDRQRAAWQSRRNMWPRQALGNALERSRNECDTAARRWAAARGLAASGSLCL